MGHKIKSQSFEGDVKHEYTFTWKIEKFSEDFTLVESEEIYLKPMCLSTWKIVIFNTEGKKSLKLALKRVDNSLHSVLIFCKFLLSNSKETPFVSRSIQGTFTGMDELKFCDKLIGRPSSVAFVKNDVGSQFRLRKDDTLIIEGKLTTNACCLCNESKELNLLELHRALVKFYNEKIFTDIDFVVGRDIIPAHKSILAARSPVFRTMLETNMKEKSENRIIIDDIELPVLEAFLTFLYTGFIETSDVNLMLQLYSVADKYDVQNLKEVCQNVLSENLNELSACEILSLADVHCDKNLSNSALNYLIDNFDLVQPTEEWSKFLCKNTSLAASVVSKVVANMRTKMS